MRNPKKRPVAVRPDAVIKMKRILVLCTGNSCRSQMAEGYLRHFSGDKAIVKSAGVEAHGVSSKAIAVMKEDGVDISGHTSNIVDEYLSMDFDFVITVCDNAKERCPVFPGKAAKFHHNFPDPANSTGSDEEVLGKFRMTRDLIRVYCRDFVTKYISPVSYVPGS